MYLPENFEETRPEVLWDLVARHPLGLLITAGPEGPMASPLPRWYPSKAETGRVVPTWNYQMVQVRGRLRLKPEADWLATQVDALTHAQEDRRPQPWAVSDAPPAFIKGQLRGILGLEIEITDMRGKWKMSQNRPLPDMAGVARGLADPADPHHDPAAAALVAERLAARGEP